MAVFQKKREAKKKTKKQKNKNESDGSWPAIQSLFFTFVLPPAPPR
jgi:hypothetical protein